MKKLMVGVLVCMFLQVFSCNSSVFAQMEDFEEFSLEELLEITVTSASGREQKQMEVSNSMFVIDREDIERSGARDVIDLFYRVPGMQVRRTDAHGAGVGIRDQASLLTKNLLVIVDGIILFNQGISGTLWQTFPVSLNEIERIEIIRGPGGVLYSANAVAGVISITTKSAKDSGNYVSVQTGSQWYAKTGTGFGGQPLKDVPLYTRAYFEFDRDEGFNKLMNGNNVNDDIERYNYGFRAEYEPSEDSKLLTLFKANHDSATHKGFLGLEQEERAQNTLAASTKWQQKVNDSYDYDIQGYWMQQGHSEFEDSDGDIFLVDLKTQHNIYFDLLGENVFSFGGEFEYLDADWAEDFVRDAENTNIIISGFIQEEWSPLENLIFTAGLRVDKNNLENEHDLIWQPRLAIVYLPVENQSIRFVASRFKRQNSFAEKDINKTIVPAANIDYVGDPDIKSEDWWTLETGYRSFWFDNKLNFNIDGFFNYIEDKIYSANSGISDVNIINNGDARIYGFEIYAEYQLSQALQITADYAYIYGDANQMDILPYGVEVENWVNGISNNTFGTGLRYTKGGFKFDVYAKYVTGIKSVPMPYASTLAGAQINEIEGHFKTMIRAAYEFDMPGTENVKSEIELVANDLFDARATESTREHMTEPVIYGGMKIKF